MVIYVSVADDGCLVFFSSHKSSTSSIQSTGSKCSPRMSQSLIQQPKQLSVGKTFQLFDDVYILTNTVVVFGLLHCLLM